MNITYPLLCGRLEAHLPSTHLAKTILETYW